eukprot:Hpha_TRINITY_DN15851_c4_g2::TRINITY_DN15851_c4_g2_i1::g.191495::m.191495
MERDEEEMMMEEEELPAMGHGMNNGARQEEELCFLAMERATTEEEERCFLEMAAEGERATEDEELSFLQAFDDPDVGADEGEKPNTYDSDLLEAFDDPNTPALTVGSAELTKRERVNHTTEAGLQLARVSMGTAVGRPGPEYNVPADAKRLGGVPVRATWLHFGVAADGKIDAERVRRFAKQIAFRRRELGLPHGSLVSGIGIWGGPESCPIKLFGFRLTDATNAVRGRQLDHILGVSQIVVPTSLREACKPLDGVVSVLTRAVRAASTAAKALLAMAKGKFTGTPEHIAALFLYTMDTPFYPSLNAVMRSPDRSKAMPYFGYLRLMFQALDSIAGVSRPKELYRGVALDLSSDHNVGSMVYWWGASSCTPTKAVAEGFLGSSGARTMFTVKPLSAVPIMEFSAFRGEEEWLLRPGTRLKVDQKIEKGDGLTEVVLSELPPPRGVQ